MVGKKTFLRLLSLLVVLGNFSFREVSASAETVNQNTVNNKKAYVYNPELQIDLKVRTALI